MGGWCQTRERCDYHTTPGGDGEPSENLCNEMARAKLRTIDWPAVVLLRPVGDLDRSFAGLIR